MPISWEAWAPGSALLSAAWTAAPAAVSRELDPRLTCASLSATGAASLSGTGPCRPRQRGGATGPARPNRREEAEREDPTRCRGIAAELGHVRSFIGKHLPSIFGGC